MTEVLDLARKLVRFPTVNPPGNEEPAMRWLGDELSATGLAVEYQQLAPERANLIARIPGSGEGHLVFCGHMDVVHPGAATWDHDPFEADLVDGRLIGRGTTDMKGGVAAMSRALIELAAENFEPQADLILAITCGEEVDMVGARHLASSGILQGSSGVVIGEPTGLDIYIAEKGVFWLRITAQGRTAHGSMPELGVNAISFMARVVSRLETMPLPFETSELLGGPSLSVNVIAGGVKTNVVPDECSIEVDMRLLPGQSKEGVRAAVERILDEVRLEVPSSAHVEVLQDVPPVATPAGSHLVAAARGAIRFACGREPNVGGVSYGTDGALIAPGLGADMIICGPGDTGQLHQPNEWVEVKQLEQAVEVYKSIARTVLAND